MFYVSLLVWMLTFDWHMSYVISLHTYNSYIQSCQPGGIVCINYNLCACSVKPNIYTWLVESKHLSPHSECVIVIVNKFNYIYNNVKEKRTYLNIILGSTKSNLWTTLNNHGYFMCCSNYSPVNFRGKHCMISTEFHISDTLNSQTVYKLLYIFIMVYFFQTMGGDGS